MAKKHKRKLSKAGRAAIIKANKEMWARRRAAKACEVRPGMTKTVPEAKLTSEANEKQVGGSHYKAFKIEPWDFNVANNMPFMEGNVIAYVARWRRKGGIADLEKAKHYLEKMIELAKKGVRVEVSGAY